MVRIWLALLYHKNPQNLRDFGDFLYAYGKL